ncbi:carbonyl reductase [NADPH] 1-like [Saccoglossus kowalevskii]|uniref:carbonyl reductase (NADPH) n=1 Tax=Saccoglossus kowalevskii TaxID=10224 RepID=A0ABM0GQ24_SACKO|nr:PREDICTED: carbonyl reductase [NADPH] 1-like [Saccoglossus kowalevskii]
MASRIAVVTGSNKGIGFAIVRALCKEFDGYVYLTARDEERGKKAVEDLEKEGLHPKFHQLDITNQKSIDNLQKYLKDKYGGLDVLVNNAAIAYKKKDAASFAEQAEVTIACNFTGTLDVCKALLPLIKPHGRVVNLASFVGKRSLDGMRDDLSSKFKSPSLTEAELVSLLEEFVVAAKAGTHTEIGYPNTAYGMSKVGVMALTGVQARDLKNDPREDILIMACCPGHVDTDMSSHQGTKTPDEGAETPAYLALLPPNSNGFQGEMFQDKKLYQWR